MSDDRPQSQHGGKLVLEHVSKEYPANRGDTVIAVRDVSFDVIENEVCVLLDIIDETQMTTVLVTHDIPEVLFIADRIVFLSSHPGSIREILPMDFKQGRRIPSKEELIETPGYVEIEREILHMMRQEASDVE